MFQCFDGPHVRRAGEGVDRHGGDEVEQQGQRPLPFLTDGGVGKGILRQQRQRLGRAETANAVSGACESRTMQRSGMETLRQMPLVPEKGTP